MSDNFWQAGSLLAHLDVTTGEVLTCVRGFDIAVAAEGPKVLECNGNPARMLYQMATDRGLLNADLAPIRDAVAARQIKQVARMTASAKQQH